MLRTGIYLANRAARPAAARENVIRNNTITGFGMDKWCVSGAPGVDLSQNHIDGNRCSALP